MLTALVLSSGAAWAAAAPVVPDGGAAIASGSVPEAQREIDAAHAAGLRWVSISATWESMEPSPDSYAVAGGPGTGAWESLRARLEYARGLGIKAEVRFNNAPGWASGRPGRADDPPTPANAQAYGDFLADVARILGGSIDAYSPWNEPNLSNFWNPVSPEAYTAVQKIAYRSIKAVDPTATVLSATIVGVYPNGYGYLTRAYQAGLRGSADVIGWNAYPHGEPEEPYRDENGLPAGSSLPGQLYLRDLIDRFDPGRKVWLMEFGWSTCAGACTSFEANGATEAAQADYLVRSFEYRRRYLQGVTDRIFWFTMRDVGTNPTNFQHNQGLLRHDFSPKPAYAALRRVAVEGDEPGAGAAPGGGAAPGALPAKAARTGLPASARSLIGRVSLGRLAVLARRGYLVVTFKVSVRGGATRVRVDGYRGRRWRSVTVVRIARSARVRLRFVDKSYAGVRIRATVPGKTGWRAARVARVPLRGLRQ